MDEYEVCINQKHSGGGKRYVAFDEAKTAADSALAAAPDRRIFVTIHHYTGPRVQSVWASYDPQQPSLG
jgi:hypothetical protein